MSTDDKIYGIKSERDTLPGGQPARKVTYSDGSVNWYSDGVCVREATSAQRLLSMPWRQLP